MLLNMKHVEQNNLIEYACTARSYCLTVHGTVNSIIVVFGYSQSMFSKLVTCQINYYPQKIIILILSSRLGFTSPTGFGARMQEKLE